MIKAIEITSLSKTYKNGVVALKDISFSVDKGEFFGLLGRNGAGKTTTIGIISSLINKNIGTVKVFGFDLDIEPNKAKSFLGLVPQEFNFNMFEKVKDIIINQAGYYGIPRADAIKRTKTLLKQLNLTSKRDELAMNLSGGMKRKLMLARALVHNPKVLILDEPTAGVDVDTRRDLWKFITKLNKEGTTIILTTHYLEEAEQLCKRIAIIDKGSIIKNTSVKTLLAELNEEVFVLDVNHAKKITSKNFNLQVIDKTTIEVSLKKEQSINALIAELTRSNIKVLSMRNKTNRLEELFIKITNDNGFN